MRPAQTMAASHHKRNELRVMLDIIYIAVVVVFFVVGGWYACFCERM